MTGTYTQAAEGTARSWLSPQAVDRRQTDFLTLMILGTEA